jgi:eukaryotic-like serine/threonine-protein kinase
VPTLAICYVQAGEREPGAALLKDDTLAAAEADSEMAYRLATYFAVEGDSSEALHWLRRAIYLGNENYPWFQKNPAWNNLRTNADFERILEDLKKGFRKNQKTWKRLLEQVPGGLPSIGANRRALPLLAMSDSTTEKSLDAECGAPSRAQSPP